ncbi:MAG: histidine kinase [Rhodospirillales bacterium]|nr:histidine kinase [Rhodospirillales bacterium]
MTEQQPSTAPEDWASVKRIIIAAQIRRYAIISQRKMERDTKFKSTKMKMLFEDQQRKFMLAKFLEDDFSTLEQKILKAAKKGEYEVEVMSFPSAYCTDAGRAVNCSEKNWPKTLQGKARSFYLIWKALGQYKGYHLKATILNFPNGFMGDVGLYIDWK